MTRMFVEPSPVDLVVAPSEVPQDINPQDPDDDLLNDYDNWRDLEDYAAAEEKWAEYYFIEAMTEYDEHMFPELDPQEVIK